MLSAVGSSPAAATLSVGDEGARGCAFGFGSATLGAIGVSAEALTFVLSGGAGGGFERSPLRAPRWGSRASSPPSTLLPSSQSPASLRAGVAEAARDTLRSRRGRGRLGAPALVSAGLGGLDLRARSGCTYRRARRRPDRWARRAVATAEAEQGGALAVVLRVDAGGGERARCDQLHVAWERRRLGDDVGRVQVVRRRRAGRARASLATNLRSCRSGACQGPSPPARPEAQSP